MPVALRAQNALNTISAPTHPVEAAVGEIVRNDKWIWENNAVFRNFPNFSDDYGFEAVEARTTRRQLHGALQRFHALFDAINGVAPVNETRAKAALAGLLIATNLAHSTIRKSAVNAATAFYSLCEHPRSRSACARYLQAHAELTIALMHANRAEVDDAWHSAFAYHAP